VIDATLATGYDAISMSPEVYEALEALREYMFDNMYLTPEVRDEFVKAQKMLTALFEYVTAHPDEFFKDTNGERVDQLALDFVAGMTDRYAMNLYAKLFLPRALR